MQQAKWLRCQGLQQREGLFTRQSSQEIGEQASDMPPLKQGAQGIYGMRNEAAEWFEAWEAWGKVIEKRCSGCGSGQV